MTEAKGVRKTVDTGPDNAMELRILQPWRSEPSLKLCWFAARMATLVPQSGRQTRKAGRLRLLILVCRFLEIV